MSENQTDKYGFLIPRGKASFKQISSLQFNARMEKWGNMIGNWEEFSKSKQKILKSRVRKGIPEPLRNRAWLLIADCLNVKKHYPNHLYFRLSNIEDDPPCIEIINRDLDRTYPDHEIFRTSEGRISLKNILRAYAHFDPEIGYCQGMGYIVGIARMHMDEESAFWVLVSLMNKYQMRGMFKQGMEQIYKSFYTSIYLLKYFEPSIWKTLQTNQVVTAMYATQWFMTISSNFPIETVLRIWDCFLYEGPKILYRVFVGFFKMNKKEFKNLTFEEILRKIRELESICDCDNLLKASFSLNLSKNKILEIDKEYTDSPNQEILLLTK